MSDERDPEATADPIERLGLEPHPEGGWYRRTYTARDAVDTPGGERPAVTLIHFYLPAGERSEWHVVSSDELWLWHGPGSLELQVGGDGDDPEPGKCALLGSPASPGAAQQALVPAGVWQRTNPGPEPVLVSCMVSPGFDFADWRLEA